MINKLFVILCVFAFLKVHSQESLSLTKRLEDSLNLAYKNINSQASKDFRKRIRASKEYRKGIIGLPLNEFEMIDVDGETITSQDLIGKITVINYWFKNCKPCIEEIPKLNKLASKYEIEEVQFIGFSITESEELGDFFERHPFNYRQVIGARDYVHSLGVTTFPTNMVLNKEGKITYSEAGFSEHTFDGLRDQIEKLIND